MCTSCLWVCLLVCLSEEGMCHHFYCLGSSCPVHCPECFCPGFGNAWGASCLSRLCRCFSQRQVFVIFPSLETSPCPTQGPCPFCMVFPCTRVSVPHSPTSMYTMCTAKCSLPGSGAVSVKSCFQSLGGMAFSLGC